MTIIDRLREMVPDDAQICDVVVGIFWTYVRTQYGVAVSATAHRWVEDPPGAIIPWQARSRCGGSLCVGVVDGAFIGKCSDIGVVSSLGDDGV